MIHYKPARPSLRNNGQSNRNTLFRFFGYPLWMYLMGCLVSLSLSLSSFVSAEIILLGSKGADGKPAEMKEYLYLQEDPASVYPIKEHVMDPTAKPDHPSFLYDPNYPVPRVVEFYASWCPHCKHFKPKYIEFAKQMDTLLTNVNMGIATTSDNNNNHNNNNNFERSLIEVEIWAVSCVPNQQICREQGVHGFPTVLMYPAHAVNGTKVNTGNMSPNKILRDLGLYQESYGSGNGNNNNIGISQQQQQQQAAPGEKPGLFKMAANNNNNNNNILPNNNNNQNNNQNNNNNNKNKNKYFTMGRSKQETFQDAHRSLIFALRNAIYATDDPLQGKRKQTLKEFLQLLQKTAPFSASFQPLLKALLADFENISSADSELIKVLDEYPLDRDDHNNNDNNNHSWSPACTQHGTGYTCGLWQLFHIITIGLVEWNLVTMEERQRIIPDYAAETIRNFIQEFFQCEECRVHFLNEYDACGHDRCNRLVRDANNEKTKIDWIQLPLWLYETHNGVNARLRLERMERNNNNNNNNNNEEEQTSPQDVLWPPMHECPKCWLSEGRWDEDVIYSFLRLQYWPEDHKSQQFRNQIFGLVPTNYGEGFHPVDRMDISFKNAAAGVVVGGGIIDDDDGVYNGRGGSGGKTQQSASIDLPLTPLAPSAIVILALGGFVVWQRKRQYDRLGYHKKRESDLPDC